MPWNTLQHQKKRMVAIKAETQMEVTAQAGKNGCDVISCLQSFSFHYGNVLRVTVQQPEHINPTKCLEVVTMTKDMMCDFYLNWKKKKAEIATLICEKNRPMNKESFQGMFFNDRDLFTGRHNYSKHVYT